MAIENTYLLGKNITLGCGFDLQAKAPLDSRQTVPSTAGLQALIDGNAAYEGMIVYDEESKKTYQAQLVDDVLAFREFGINEAELKDLIASETTAAMEFKGAATALPENPAKGDMYKVTASFKVGEEDVKVGDSIVYDGEQWFIIPSGDDIEDTWRPVTGVDNDSTLTFAAGDKLEKTVAADGTITYKHAAIDAPENMNAEGDEHTRTYLTQLITDNHGHIIGFKTATENVEDTNTTYVFEGQSDDPTDVYFLVTSSDVGAADAIYLNAYSKNEADGKFVAKETGKSLISDDEIARLAKVDNYDDEEVRGLIDAIDNHSHENKDVLDGITAAKVADWDDAVSKEHTHTFVDSDVEDAITKKHSHTFTDEDVEDAISKEHTHSFADEEALNGITAAKVADWDDAVSKEHTHSFVDSDVEDAISKKHAHTFVDTDVEDAISKKHSHTFVETELNKIVDGDVAKWNTAAGKADDNAQAIEDLEGYVGTFTHATAKTVVEYINAKTDGIATSGNLEALGTRVTTAEGKIADLEAASATHATKDELNDVDKKFENYNTKEVQKAIDDAQDAKIKAISDDYVRAADIANFETKENVKKVSDDLAAYIESNDEALAAETKARTDADAGFETRIAALEGNFGDGEGTVEAQIAAAVKAEEDARKEAVQGVQDAVDAIEADYVKAADIANFATDTELGAVETALNNYKTDNDAAVALKADKSVVDAMYTNGQIDTAVQGAKDYAKGLVDAIPAQTDYSVTITENTDDNTVAKTYVFSQCGAEIGSIKLAKELVVTSGSVKEVTEAGKPYEGAVVGEKYIELVIANQDTPIYVPAKDLVDIYTAKDGATEVQVAISNTNEISATLVNGGVAKEKLAADVQASLALADSALQEHQDISHLAVKTQVATDIENAVKVETDRAVAAEGVLSGRIDALEAIDHDHSNKTVLDGITSDKVTAWDNAQANAETKAAELDTALHTVISKEIDDDVKAAIDAEVLRANGAYDATGSAAAAQAAAIADAATKYETIGTAQGIVDGLKLSETYEPIGAETRAITAAKTETENQVKALAGEGNTSTVKKNADDIASLLAQLQWGEF